MEALMQNLQLRDADENTKASRQSNMIIDAPMFEKIEPTVTPRAIVEAKTDALQYISISLGRVQPFLWKIINQTCIRAINLTVERPPTTAAAWFKSMDPNTDDEGILAIFHYRVAHPIYEAIYNSHLCLMQATERIGYVLEVRESAIEMADEQIIDHLKAEAQNILYDQVSMARYHLNGLLFACCANRERLGNDIYEHCTNLTNEEREIFILGQWHAWKEVSRWDAEAKRGIEYQVEAMLAACQDPKIEEYELGHVVGVIDEAAMELEKVIWEEGDLEMD